MSHQPPAVELLQRIETGDEEALFTLHARYINLVYSVAYQVLEDQMAAEEVAQDTFMRLWEKAASYDPAKGEFITWLLTITRRLAIDYLRKRQRQEPHHNTLFIDDNPELWENVLSTEISDLRRSLVGILQQLPPEQRDAIGLAYFYGMSHSDIAAYRQVPLGTIKTRIRQGMQKLRSMWLSEQPVNPNSNTGT
ncbi:MAG TPA: sigma-70 family RNA polymerase sigma factor [Spirillospora sp.]|nr:sigma-70 family RNA polymerase sigma factor [Spirillospora sp.]